jgi:FAD synthase
VTRLPDAEPGSRHVAIGTFDGVHVGHRAVIDGADTVLTFEPHPLRILHPEAAPKLIMTFDVKRDVIEGLRVDELVVIPFDERFKSIEAEEFVRGVLIDRLGAPFLLEGRVVEGDRRGRTLGFPTANVVPDDALVVPGHGVYAGFANGRPAAINVGVRPTFETGRGLLVEAYLIDFDADLYGQVLRVAFIERLRGERRFESVEDLVAQMRRDVEEARELCASFTPPSR